jgi:DNA polymerase I-like protein with 3'-5' exonuclease and polymerase domains
MKILTLDTEHSYGIMRPWEKGFYLSCVAYHWIRDGISDPDVNLLWVCHSEVEQLPMPPIMAEVQRLVDEADVVVGHNLKHDLNILRYYGIDFESTTLWCTMLTEYLLAGQDSQRSWGLDSVSEFRGIGYKDSSIADLWNKGLETYDIPKEWLGRYAKKDVELTATLCLAQRQEVQEKDMEALILLQNEFILSLSDMELNGMGFNVEKAEEIYDSYTKASKLVHEELIEIFGEPRLNLGSGHQLSAALFGGSVEVSSTAWVTKTLKTKPETRYYEKTYRETVSLHGIFSAPVGSETKREGVYSTDKQTIDALPQNTAIRRKVKESLFFLSATDKVRETLRGRKNDTGLISKCIEQRIHPNFNQCVTSTGRLSSSDPNAQNLPRGSTSPIKECISSRFGRLVQFDLSQIEWRVASYLSQDRTMMHEIKQGVDQHAAACVDIMKLPFKDKSDPESKVNRDYAKVFNFRMIYGGTVHGFFSDNKMPSFSKMQWGSIIRGFYNKYQGLKEWQDEVVKRSILCGELVAPTGRRFRFNKSIYRNGGLEYNERQFKNYPVQGIAGGDILPLCTILIRRGLRHSGLRSKLILTVHDSIVLDCPLDEVKRVAKLCYLIAKNLDKTISNYFGIDWNVKLDGECEVGTNYGNLKEITYAEAMDCNN